MKIIAFPFKFILIALFLVLFFISVFISTGIASGGYQGFSIKNKMGQIIGSYEESHALVIGVSQYKNFTKDYLNWADLPGVKEDVKAIKKELERQGFHVVLVNDPTQMELKSAFKDFIIRYGKNPGNRLLFYFSGHGHTLNLSKGLEMGYIVPADAPNPKWNKSGFLAKAVDMKLIEVYARQIQAKHALFIFDSCLSGSIFSLEKPALEHISYKTNKPVRQFIFAGTTNEVLLDEGIFRGQFAAALKGEADFDNDKYVTGAELGEFLQKTVVDYSRGYQHPQYGKIRDRRLNKGDFVFSLIPEKQPVVIGKSALEKEKINLEAEQLKLLEEKIRLEEERVVLKERRRIAKEHLKLKAEINKVKQEHEEMKVASIEPQVPQKSTPKLPVQKGMVYIKGGCYQMGDLFDEGDPDEKVHKVCVEDFFMAEYEVTQKEWRDVMGNNPSRFKKCGDNCPVAQVSWDDVQDFVQNMNKKTGLNYRLPTEAEWEYAAKSKGKKYNYSWGNGAPNGNKGGNIADEEGKRKYPSWDIWEGYKDGFVYSAPVGSFKPNELGLYDMTGNVWEWVSDRYGKYIQSSARNPKGPSRGPFRVSRGGSWLSRPGTVRVSNRNSGMPNLKNFDMGFRLAKTP